MERHLAIQHSFHQAKCHNLITSAAAISAAVVVRLPHTPQDDLRSARVARGRWTSYSL